MGDLAGAEDKLSFDYFLGKIFIPIAYLMGVPSEDAENVAKLVGIKTAVNEFVAFDMLGKWQKETPPRISARAGVIATYALCGFANPSSIGIQLGGLGAIAPERKTDFVPYFQFSKYVNLSVSKTLVERLQDDEILPPH